MTLPSAQKQLGLHGTVSADAHDRRKIFLAVHGTALHSVEVKGRVDAEKGRSLEIRYDCELWDAQRTGS